VQSGFVPVVARALIVFPSYEHAALMKFVVEPPISRGLDHQTAALIRTHVSKISFVSRPGDEIIVRNLSSPAEEHTN